MPRRLALLVGVDRYPNFSPEKQLRCCAEDARLMAHVLRERFGFVEEDLTCLLDEAATREGILTGLRSLLANVRPGDSVVFYYSGHGSQIADGEGDEPDGLDETLVPYDGVRPDTSQDVIDDEIHDWVLRISEITPNVTVIADTCFSGGLARKGLVEKWVEPGLRTRTRLRTAARKSEDGPSGFLPESDRYTLLAACRAGETAKVMHSKVSSVFTFFLCQEFLRAPKDATYREVMERTRIAVAATPEARDQTPQLEGARDRLLFGLKSIEPARYLPLESREGNRVRLGGGIVHFVDPGSQWEIYPPGTRQPKGTKPLGLVRIDEVQAVSAEAEILKERSPIQPGARAFEKSKGPGWMRLAVGIEAPHLDRTTVIDLGRRIERSRNLRLVEEPSQADARILADQAAEASWTVLGRDEQQMIPSIPLRRPGSVARLVGDLETRARYLNLLRLSAGDEGNPLRNCLEVQLLRRSADGDFRPARPDKATGEVVYREGEYLALRVSHRAERPLYIHVIDLGLTGSIDLFYPVGGSYKALPPGKAFDIGVQPGQRITVRIPKAFTTGSREFLKVFATTHEADLTWLRQPGFGSAPPSGGQPRSGIASLLWQALGGGSRQSLPPAPGENEGWTVVTLSFLVR